MRKMSYNRNDGNNKNIRRGGIENMDTYETSSKKEQYWNPDISGNELFKRIEENKKKLEEQEFLKMWNFEDYERGGLITNFNKSDTKAYENAIRRFSKLYSSEKLYIIESAYGVERGKWGKLDNKSALFHKGEWKNTSKYFNMIKMFFDFVDQERKALL
jgi:hypothetical protein